MANQATTTYKVTGTQKAVSNLWNTLQRMEVNSRNIWLDDLAKHYGIDYQKKHITCVVTSTGQSMRRMKTPVCFPPRPKLPGMLAMTSSLR